MKCLGMPLINCEINLILTWSKDCVIFSTTGKTMFKITDTKIYIPVVTLWNLDNVKLKFRFGRIINWNKYLSKLSTKGQNIYLDYLIHCCFQKTNRSFVLSFKCVAKRNIKFEDYKHCL